MEHFRYNFEFNKGKRSFQSKSIVKTISIIHETQLVTVLNRLGSRHDGATLSKIAESVTVVSIRSHFAILLHNAFMCECAINILKPVSILAKYRETHNLKSEILERVI